MHVFGQLPNGETIHAYTLCNKNGFRIKLIDYGATLVSFKIPTVANQTKELALGFDTLDEYITHPYYFGCTIGRVANRISHGKFLFQNKQIQLTRNIKQHHLHGGLNGFDKKIWHAKPFQTDKSTGVTFSRVSHDGEEGYPGNLEVQTIYELDDDNALTICFLATTDQTTPVSLTNHTYWNLAGAGTQSILNHELQLSSNQFLATDDHLIPTGDIKSVINTPFDFTAPKLLADHIHQSNGYDLCYVLNNMKQELNHVATVRDTHSNRTMDVYTTQPAMQFYSGNYLAETKIADNRITNQHGGFCLETQSLSDAVNHSHFPSTLLHPGETYHHKTIFKVSNT